MENEWRDLQPREEIPPQEIKGSRNFRKKVGRSVRSILDGSFLTKERVVRAIPFLLFLFALALVYIANVFYVEKMIREMDDVEKEIQELRYEFITTKSRLMNESKSSEIAKKLETEGIKPSIVPPEKIEMKEKP